MARRGMAVAAGVLLAAVGVVGCGPEKGSSQAGPAPVATVTVTAAPTAPAVPTATGTPAPVPGKSQAAGDAPGVSCTEPTVKAGDKVVIPGARPKQAIMFAKVAQFACDPGGGHFVGDKAPETFQFAAGAKAQLVLDDGTYRDVLVGDLWVHIGDCLDGGANVQPPLSCSNFPAYEITQNAKGEITAIKELWHS
ncbi:hypothetical protein CFP65_3925 [Kitasatospora sp. MMS16-BH015]|uniref:hypothetical protein n=1 Tax=Kitasatospora sp. MMS16-BH015 TaxID=2018025 RepID=UPI000CA39501|nr:hypothetical protein [Kitasatospora sp. MMS16-BH015]AUG78698.1 hypothetical protein CFP65_3925 [Kitasatospora sp. MMS16-BH015]